ncbi:MAG: hypothetical protein ACLGHG_07215 [Gammaproteobacteria bacterium]
MNAQNHSAEHAGAHLSPLVRRFPLAVRVMELVLAVALYLGGLIAVASLTGKAGSLVTVYAIFAMPLVLSVGLRLYRTLERRVSHLREDNPLGHAG